MDQAMILHHVAPRPIAPFPKKHVKLISTITNKLNSFDLGSGPHLYYDGDFIIGDVVSILRTSRFIIYDNCSHTVCDESYIEGKYIVCNIQNLQLKHNFLFFSFTRQMTLATCINESGELVEMMIALKYVNVVLRIILKLMSMILTFDYPNFDFRKNFIHVNYYL